MQVGRTFMVFNSNLFNVEKYQLNWLRVLNLCERTWVQVLCMIFM